MTALLIMLSCELGPRIEPMAPLLVEFKGHLYSIENRELPNKRGLAPQAVFNVSIVVEDARWQRDGSRVNDWQERFADYRYSDRAHTFIARPEALPSPFPPEGAQVILVWDDANSEVVSVMSVDASRRILP